MNNIGKTIAGARRKLKLTQQALANELGVTVMTVSRWERGTQAPDTANLVRLCEVLGIELRKALHAQGIKSSSARA